MQFFKNKSFSIFYRLLISSLLFASFIVITLLVIFYYSNKNYITKHIKEVARQQIDSVSYNFHHLKDELILNTKITASNPVVDNFLTSSRLNYEINKRALERLFSKALSHSDNLQSIYFVDYMGKEKVGVDQKGGRKKIHRDVSDTRVFKDLVSDTPGIVAVNGPYFDEDGQVMFSTGVNVIDGDIGEFGGAVFVDYNLKEFLSSLNNLKIHDENHVWAFTQDGDVLKKPSNKGHIIAPKPYMSNDYNETIRFVMADSGIITYKDITITDKQFIRVAICLPSSLLLKDVKATLQFTLIVLLIFTGIIVISVYFQSRHFAQPIVELSKAASELAKGKLSSHVTVKAIGEVALLVNSFNQMAQDLQRTTVSKNYVDSIINTMGNILIVVNQAGEIIKVNKTVYDMLGYTDKEIIGKNLETITSTKSGAENEENTIDIKSLIGEESVNNIELDFLSKDGKSIPTLFSSALMPDTKDGKEIVCIAQDITERKEAEKEKEAIMLDLRERIKDLDGLYSLGALTEQVEEVETLFNSFLKEIVPKSMQFPDKAIAKIVLDDKVFCSTYDDYCPIDDFTTHISAPIIVTGHERGALTVGYTENLPFIEHFEQQLINSYAERLGKFIEQKETEQVKQDLWYQLLQSQKLESVGRLTGKIAHDFNNYLTTIIGFSSLAYDKLPTSSIVKDLIGRVYTTGEKASKLIDQLLAFSRKQILDIKVINLNTIIKSITDILTGVVGEDVTIEFNIDTPVKNIKADETQIEQILMNLIVNARHAMPKGGLITVSTSNVDLDEKSAKAYQGASPGSFVKLSVTDTGIGMDHKTIQKIFEPFFTTRKKGEGTGLGLSTVFGIVNQHDGFLDVKSALDVGTTFDIYFPATKMKVSPKVEGKEPTKKFGSESILIVEDDLNNLDYYISQLSPLGYSIIKAKNGEKAIELLSGTDKRIDLLLTDVVLPGINGWELYIKIKEERPDMKAIFTSGFIDNPIVQNNIFKNKMPFLKKPFTPDHLTTKIREVLDG